MKVDRNTQGGDTNVLKVFRQMQLEDRWSIMGMFWEHVEHWLLHFISECRCRRIRPIRKKLEVLGPL